ncbi:MAG: DUF3047 domain-containing protein [Deltaproteobacteria bacterium]|nr:DUF3047 domain-containing protein [Deltaproteobacteria bacterium]
MIFLILLFLLIPISSNAYLSVQSPRQKVIEDFSDDLVGAYPKKFRTRPFQRSRAAQVYRVRSEGGNQYLSADDTEEISTQIFRRFFWEIQKQPRLQWKWRPRVLPLNAKESAPDRNDSACEVYVTFGSYSGDGLKYVWSSTLPVGTVYEKKKGHFFIVVKGTGKATGGWRSVDLDVLEDYRKFFGKEPKENPIGFGILTDGNATHSPAACDYDDFTILKD